jgi:hypothetical protein
VSDGRKTYYVSVGAGQVLEDKEAAPFEFEIRANEEELSRLQQLFEDLSSADEAAAFHFPRQLTTQSLDDMNENYQHHLQEIYKLLYQLGTEETKRHIESIHILPEDQPAEAKPH